MPKIKINGNKSLTGEINISGAKNSAVALIPAALLCDEEVKIYNVPNISDTKDLEEILSFLNAKVEVGKESININTKDIVNKSIPQELSSKLRASYYFMGVLLGKFKKVDIHFPGGCSIGKRPINLHLDGFKKLGANIVEEDDHFVITAENNKFDQIISYCLDNKVYDLSQINEYLYTFCSASL